MAQACSQANGLHPLTQAKSHTDSNGIYHVTYGFSDINGNAISSPSVLDPSTAAVSNGFSEWNTFTQTTNIEFDLVPPGMTPDIHVHPVASDDNALGCAAFNTWSRTIVYGPSFVASTTTSPTNGHTIMSHEIGHALGLADGGVLALPPSIMNNGRTCVGIQLSTSNVLPSDAAAVPVCTARARLVYQNYLLESGTTARTIGYEQVLGRSNLYFQTNCFYEYAQVNFYVNGYFDSSSWDVVGMTCQ